MESTSESPRRIKDELLSKIMNSCRVCMSRSVNMNNIFDSKHKNVIKQLHFCTGITPTKDDGLPPKICKQCFKNLSIAFKFKTSCLLADNTFRKLLNSHAIKKEEPDVCDDEFRDDIEFDDDVIGDNDVKEEVVELKETAVVDDDDDDDVSVLKVQSKSIKIKEEKESIKPVTNRRPGRPPGPARRYKKLRFRRLHCEPCGISFETKAESTQHKKDAHKDSETWVCEVCGKFFVHRASHYTHMRSHQPPQYACDQCDYKTWHKHDLIKHIRIHTGNKLYQCEYCTQSFYTSSNLMGHIRRSHMNERPHACSLCRKTFFDKTKLNRHIDSHNDIRRYECEICHSSFTRRCYWKKHLLSQHNIDTPPQRPGRPKTNLVIGEDLMNQPPNNICTMTQNTQISEIRQVGPVIVIGHGKDYYDRKEIFSRI